VSQRKAKPTPKSADQESHGIYGLLKQINNTSTGRFISSVVMALLIVIPVRIFALQGYHIPSGSMKDTLLIGDVLFADKITFGPRIPFTNGARIPGFRDPKVGDIVIFKSPVDNIDLIKRCVAVAGQTVEVKDKQLYVDGQARVEPYTIHTGPRGGRGDNFGPFKVPAGHIFVMGDNRDNSNDSRFWGFVPEENLVGKAFIIWLNWDINGKIFDVGRIGNGID
jgi:signal peptidase I